MTTAELEYLVRVQDRDLKELQRSIRETNRALGAETADASTRGSRALASLGNAAKVASAAILGGLGVAVKLGIDELSEAERVSAQTAATLKSTGGVANVTAKDIEGLAGQLSRLSGVDDEVIQSGQNLLLTFTNLRNEAGRGNDIFNQATRTMLDMSVALGQDTRSSAIQLGKALNDPIRGVTALQRVGVSFTEQQREQIRTLVESGRTLDAQKMILAELNREFGGSAEAAGNTFAGSLNKAKNAASELLASLVQGLLPAFTTLAGAASTAVAFLGEHTTAVKVGAVALAALATAILAVNAAMRVYRAAAIAMTAAQVALNVAMAANPVGIIIAALVALGAALAVAWAKSETFRNVVTAAWEKIKEVTVAVFGAVVEFIRSHWEVIVGIFTGGLGLIVAFVIKHWDGIKSATSSMVDAIVGFFTALPGRLAGMLATLASVFIEPFKAAYAAARDFIRDSVIGAPGAGGIVGFFTALPGRLAGMLGALGETFLTPFRNAYAAARDFIRDSVIDRLVGFFDALPGRLWEAVQKAWGTFRDGIQGAFAAVRDFIRDRVIGSADNGGIVGFFARLPDRIWAAMSRALADLGRRIKDFFAGLKDDIVGFFTGLGGDIAGFFSGIFGGAAPPGERPPPIMGGPGLHLPPTPFPATHETSGLPGYPASDYLAPPGTPVYAPFSGVVTKISGGNYWYDGVGGFSIYLQGASGIAFLTHFAANLAVAVGQAVAAGQLLGYVGNPTSGMAPHIHYGLHVFHAGGVVPGLPWQDVPIIARGGEMVLTPEQVDLLRLRLAEPAERVVITGNTFVIRDDLDARAVGSALAARLAVLR